jgi:hypothetical protein
MHALHRPLPLRIQHIQPRQPLQIPPLIKRPQRHPKPPTLIRAQHGLRTPRAPVVRRARHEQRPELREEPPELVWDEAEHAAGGVVRVA